MDRSKMTLEEKIHAAESCCELESEYAFHNYYHMRDEKRPADATHPDGFDTSVRWAHTQTIAGSHNFGATIGYYNAVTNWTAGMHRGRQMRIAQICEKYPEMKATGMYGGIGLHLLASGVIEIAEDGMSAKSSWLTPGLYGSNVDTSGRKTGGWDHERYAVDWLYEDGEWNVLHNMIVNDFHAPVDGVNVAEDAYNELMKTGMIEGGDEMAPPGVGIPGPAHMGVNLVQPVQFDCRPPEPYRTLGETFAYLPTPGLDKRWIKVFDVEAPTDDN